MKKLILAAFALTCAASVFAQGTVLFANRIGTTLQAPIYGVNPGAPGVQVAGNSPTGIPAGTADYGTAPKLDGTAYLAQLWGGPNATSLSAATGTSLLGFRTGAGAGFIVATSDAAIIAGVTTGSSAALQVRAWDTQGGTLMTWAAAEGANANRGMSAIFNSEALGGGAVPAANMIGFTSFNLVGAAAVTPEPSTFALAGLGAAALLIFRRRK